MDFALHTWTWEHCPPFLGYQGLHPLNETVRCVLLAKDANFPSDELLNGNPAARALLASYLRNPGEFFRQNRGCHHPFIHPDWGIKSHDGGRYHRRLRRLLELANVPAESVSILEMLRLPTTGNSGRCALFKQAVAAQIQNPEVQLEHLNLLNNVLGNAGKRVIVFSGFLGLWNSFSEAQRQVLINNAPLLGSLAEWLALPIEGRGAMPDGILAHVHIHTHLSNAITNDELGQMAQIIAG